MTLPPAANAMHQLDWFLGQWAVRSRYKKPDGDWLEAQLTANHRWILGGHVIFEHFEGPVFGEPFEAWSLRKYNPQAGHWEQRWVDTTPGGFADWTGAWDADQQTFTGHPNRVLNEDGTLKAKAAREVFYEIAADHFSWKYERTEDGGSTWQLVWTLDYTRTETV